MKQKTFKLYNWIACSLVTIVAAVTYLLTVESSASFWDCGEFIASSYKLEVGHPPGNPTFQLLARVFTIPFGPENAAVAVNALSAICSAFTIFFLYLTIVFFAKRLVLPKGVVEDDHVSASSAIAIIGSGMVGALAYAFSDTFWFSAVEAEVYAMSSLFTAMVLWAMTRWYEDADSAYANKWIVLIAFLMGLSIGVHLLNLLTIPALVFLYFFKKKEEALYKPKQALGIFFLGIAILGILNFIIIPYLPKLAAGFDLFFVNVLGCPFNTGAIFFVLLLFVLGFIGAFLTLKRNKPVWNTVIVCGIAILAGYSLFSICVIRSCAKTPTNEYQPDNPYTLVRYLSREQYGSTPLLYGQYFDCPMESSRETSFRTPLRGKYVRTEGQPDIVYSKEGKMFFPRMHSSADEHAKFYKNYVRNGTRVQGANYEKPSFGDNLGFFFDFQMHWMYWRYFMWNFAGRQNEIHSPSPGNVLHGNWESGITFLDKLRLGDQSNAPDYLKNNKGKNHYYFLPLLLGLLGLCFQCSRDHRGWWVNFLIFIMTGIAIVVFLNQPPYQVRERDYAYAGSFYAFSVWIGLAVTAVLSLVNKLTQCEKTRAALVSLASLLCLGVPTLMAEQNWDDHDRHNRRTAAEVAYNYLNSVGPNGILVTHGDNDTFPVWYAQEVEGVRTDVRICNTSLLGTDWHIDQMRYACNQSAPLPISVPMDQYLYGTNEFVYIVDTRDTVISIKDVMAVFKSDKAKVRLESGRRVDYIMSRKISVPVNKENVLKYGILSEAFADQIPDRIILTISKDKNYITKPELFMLDLLSGYEWDRPINMLGMGGDINIGIKEYLMYEGFSYKFVPIKTKCKRYEPGIVDMNELDSLVNKVYKWDAISADNWLVDYQNIYTFCGVMNYRDMFSTMARLYNKAGRHEEAEKMLDKCMSVMRPEMFPLNMSSLHVGNELAVCNIIQEYYLAGATQKGHDLAKAFAQEMVDAAMFYVDFSKYFPKQGKNGMDDSLAYLEHLCYEILPKCGDKELSQEIISALEPQEE